MSIELITFGFMNRYTVHSYINISSNYDYSNDACSYYRIEEKNVCLSDRVNKINCLNVVNFVVTYRTIATFLLITFTIQVTSVARKYQIGSTK